MVIQVETIINEFRRLAYLLSEGREEPTATTDHPSPNSPEDIVSAFETAFEKIKRVKSKDRENRDTILSKMSMTMMIGDNVQSLLWKVLHKDLMDAERKTRDEAQARGPRRDTVADGKAGQHERRQRGQGDQNRREDRRGTPKTANGDGDRGNSRGDVRKVLQPATDVINAGKSDQKAGGGDTMIGKNGATSRRPSTASLKPSQSRPAASLELQERPQSGTKKQAEPSEQKAQKQKQQQQKETQQQQQKQEQHKPQLQKQPSMKSLSSKDQQPRSETTKEKLPKGLARTAPNTEPKQKIIATTDAAHAKTFDSATAGAAAISAEGEPRRAPRPPKKKKTAENLSSQAPQSVESKVQQSTLTKSQQQSSKKDGPTSKMLSNDSKNPIENTVPSNRSSRPSTTANHGHEQLRKKSSKNFEASTGNINIQAARSDFSLHPPAPAAADGEVHPAEKLKNWQPRKKSTSQKAAPAGGNL
jgi:hypothetical protein